MQIIPILNNLHVDSQLTRLHLHFASTKSSTFVRLASSQLKTNVGRRGTNWAQSPPHLEWYLDVLVKHTTEIPPPAALVEGTAPSALVEGVSLRWFILSCEYLISLNQIHAHTCYQSHRGNGSQNLQRLSDFLQWLSDFPQRLSKILNSFLLSKKSKKIYLRQEVYKRSLFELCIFCHSLSHSRSKLRNTRYNTQQKVCW